MADLPNYFTRQTQKQTIEASFESLHEKIATLSYKIATLQLPFDISQREAIRQQVQNEVRVGKPGVLELHQGIALLEQRSEETARVALLRQELETLGRFIERAKPMVEEHFNKVIQQQYSYKLAQELRDLVTNFEKRAAPKVLANLSPVDQVTLHQAKDILMTSKMSTEAYKELFGRVAVIVSKQPEAAREMRAVSADARRLDQPETLISELVQAKNVKITKEQVLKAIADELPRIIDQAFAHQGKSGWFSEAEPLVNERLSQEERAMLREVKSANLAKLPPDTLILRAKKTLQVIERGFASVPADVAAKQKVLARAIEIYEEQFKAVRLNVEQRKELSGEIASNAVRVIDHAFDAKTATGRGVLQGKLLPNERAALQTAKAKMTSLTADPAKLKKAVQDALDLIDKAFSSEVPPFRSMPVPAELKAKMVAIRNDLKLLA